MSNQSLSSSLSLCGGGYLCTWTRNRCPPPSLMQPERVAPIMRERERDSSALSCANIFLLGCLHRLLLLLLPRNATITRSILSCLIWLCILYPRKQSLHCLPWAPWSFCHSVYTYIYIYVYGRLFLFCVYIYIYYCVGLNARETDSRPFFCELFFPRALLFLWGGSFVRYCCYWEKFYGQGYTRWKPALTPMSVRRWRIVIWLIFFFLDVAWDLRKALHWDWLDFKRQNIVYQSHIIFNGFSENIWLRQTDDESSNINHSGYKTLY